MAHHCHVPGCPQAVPPKLFMCTPHWYALRKPIRDAIWREYRPGQECDKRPTARYMAVHRLAIAELLFKPFDEAAAYRAAEYIEKAVRWQQRAVDRGEGDPLAGLVPETKP